jgi:hypothetical protein
VRLIVVCICLAASTARADLTGGSMHVGGLTCRIDRSDRSDRPPEVPIRELESAEPELKQFVAMRLDDILFYERIGFGGTDAEREQIRRRNRASTRAFRVRLEQFNAALGRAWQVYERQRLKGGLAEIATEARLGQLCWHYADALKPLPWVMCGTDEELRIWQGPHWNIYREPSLYIDQLFEHAIEHFEHCVDLSHRQGLLDRWLPLCLEALNRLKPDAYPADNELYYTR